MPRQTRRKNKVKKSKSVKGAKQSTGIEKWKLLVVPAAVLLLFVTLGLPKNNPPQTPYSSPPAIKTTPVPKSGLTKTEAISKVKALPEVADYLKKVPNGQVAVGGEEESSYLVQVFEVKDGHTATFNWYQVAKKTGEVKREF